jgi:hypothetical protein
VRERVRALVAAVAVATVAIALGGEPARTASTASNRAADSLPAACAYLWSRQAPDGGWHSQTYGLMRAGDALTPFVLHALLTAPTDQCVAPPGGADRALIEKMRARLAREQLGPVRGFTEASSPAFGGWGFGGVHPPGVTGHMDLSHTRKVLQALREAGGTDAAVYERALVFLRLMQRHPSETRPHPAPLFVPAHPPRGLRYDGGFFFSPVVLDANKGAVLADERGAFHGSYATATADGVLALLAAGVPASDERVQGARAWLLAHGSLDRPDGIPPDGPQAWGAAVDFYHLAVRAEAYRALGLEASLREALPRVLGPRQRGDGSFANDRSHLMKEDEPLLATALAVLAWPSRALQGTGDRGFRVEPCRIEERDRRVPGPDQGRDLRAAEDDALRAAGHEAVDDAKVALARGRSLPAHTQLLVDHAVHVVAVA